MTDVIIIMNNIAKMPTLHFLIKKNVLVLASLYNLYLYGTGHLSGIETEVARVRCHRNHCFLFPVETKLDCE